LKRPEVLDYLRKNYVAGSSIIVAAGRIKHRQVLRAVGRYARNLNVGPRPQFGPVRNNQRGLQIRLFTKKTEQTQIALGIRTCSRRDERRYALRLLNTILGENMSSRLFQVVREDHGLAYSIYSSPSFFDDIGDLVISAGLETDNVPRTLRLIARELRRFTESPPSAAELRQARDYVIGQMDLGLESTDNQMNWLGEQLLGYGRIFQPGEVKRRLRAVTSGEIRAVAQDFFKPDRLNLALVSPLKTDKYLAKSLRL
jgi:predicted Zn-dependent peptidase